MELEKLKEDSPLRDVLQHFDSKAALGAVLGITRQGVSNMCMGSPLSRVHYMALRYEKRPDLYQVDEEAAA